MPGGVYTFSQLSVSQSDLSGEGGRACSALDPLSVRVTTLSRAVCGASAGGGAGGSGAVACGSLPSADDADRPGACAAGKGKGAGHGREPGPGGVSDA